MRFSWRRFIWTGMFSFYIITASLWGSGGHSTVAATEAVEDVPLVTSRTTTSTSMTEKVLTTREIEDVVYQTVYACQDDILQLSCLDNYLIQIVRANYGRFSIEICNEMGRTDFSVNCISNQSSYILQQRCNGRSACEAFANATHFPNDIDPCPSTVKYLEAQFYCMKMKITQPPPSPTSEVFNFTDGPISEKFPTKRIPITSKPKSTRPEVHQLTGINDSNNNVTIISILKNRMATVQESDIQSKFTSKFLSSSIASTNIMDTSDLPVTIETTKTTTLATSTTTKAPTTSRRIAKTTSAFAKQQQNTQFEKKPIVVVPSSSFYLESNKPYPIIPTTRHYSTATTTSTLPTSTRSQAPPSLGNGLKCLPLLKVGLQWPQTEAGQMAAVDCGPKAAGLAYWTCSIDGKWLGTPDLTQCQSYWLQKLRQQLDKQASIVHVANDLTHYTSSFRPLSPGDLLLLIDTIEVMTSRMKNDLGTIPTLDQRRAVITEVVQDILKTISLAVNLEDNGLAWERLGGASKRRKCVTLMITVLENAGLLLPEVVHENKEVTVTSPNILMSVKGMNFNHMNKMKLPSEAAVASEHWSNFTNSVDIPSLDLMEHMQQGGRAQIMFLSFKNLHKILPPPENQQEDELKVISNVISVTMGEKTSKERNGIKATTVVRLNQPITITFVHDVDLFEAPKCAFWNTLTHRWSTLGCQLVSSNRTHSSCACRRLATFALLAPSDGLGGSHYMRNGGATNDVLIGVLAAFFLVLLLLIIVVLACYCRHKKAMHGYTISNLCCQRTSFKLICNGWFRSIKSYLCCHLPRGARLRKPVHESTTQRSGSFTTPSFFNERLYELHDNSGSVMTTPTFYPPNRGDELLFNTSRSLHQMNHGYVQSPTRQVNQSSGAGWQGEHLEASRRALTLNVSKSIWPTRDLVTTPERPLLTDMPSPVLDYNNHIYHEVPDLQGNLQPIHRPIQAQLNLQQQCATAGSNGIKPFQQCESSGTSSSSGYASVSGSRYDNVRGAARGPFVSYLEDSQCAQVHYRQPPPHPTTTLVEPKPLRPRDLALPRSPLI